MKTSTSGKIQEFFTMKMRFWKSLYFEIYLAG